MICHKLLVDTLRKYLYILEHFNAPRKLTLLDIIFQLFPAKLNVFFCLNHNTNNNLFELSDFDIIGLCFCFDDYWHLFLEMLDHIFSLKELSLFLDIKLDDLPRRSFLNIRYPVLKAPHHKLNFLFVLHSGGCSACPTGPPLSNDPVL